MQTPHPFYVRKPCQLFDRTAQDLNLHKDILTAQQLLESAEDYIGTHTALKGWVFILKATIASMQGRKRQCEYWLTKAMDSAFSIPQIPEYVDSVFTEFSHVSVTSWSGYCLLELQEPSKAYERLTEIDFQELSERRKADYLQDLSKACILIGELTLAQTYILQSIEKATYRPPPTEI